MLQQRDKEVENGIIEDCSIALLPRPRQVLNEVLSPTLVRRHLKHAAPAARY